MASRDEQDRRARHDHKNSHDLESARKPYRSPQLFVYGDIRELTQAVAHAGALDGAPLNLKTGI